MNRGKLILVTGGARSGKSSFAERYAEQSGKPVLYLATAKILDPEMFQRVEEHRRRRPPHFKLAEEPYSPEKILAAAGAGTFVLLDCLTVLLNNHLLKEPAMEDDLPAAKQTAISNALLDYFSGLAGTLKNCPADVLVVTNEVGAGIVPDYPLGRLFRDLAGRVNQLIAARADEVWFTVCGLAKRFK